MLHAWTSLFLVASNLFFEQIQGRGQRKFQVLTLFDVAACRRVFSTHYENWMMMVFSVGTFGQGGWSHCGEFSGWRVGVVGVFGGRMLLVDLFLGEGGGEGFDGWEDGTSLQAKANQRQIIGILETPDFLS